MCSREIIISVDNYGDKRKIILQSIEYEDFIKKLRDTYNIDKNEWKKYRIFYTDYTGTYKITNRYEYNVHINCTSYLNIRLFYETDLSKFFILSEKWLFLLHFIILLFGFVMIIIFLPQDFQNICGLILIFVSSLDYSVLLLNSKSCFYDDKNIENQIISIIQKTDGKMDKTDYEHIKCLLYRKPFIY